MRAFFENAILADLGEVLSTGLAIPVAVLVILFVGLMRRER